MSVTANLTTNVETITATIVVEDETIIAEINTAARGPAGADGSGTNSITSATTSDGTADLDLLNVDTVTATVSGTLTADHIHGNLAGNVYGHVRAGETLEKGDPVYVSGSHGSGSTLIPIVSKADASNAAKMPAIGIMDAGVTIHNNGHMVIVGTITELDTDGLTVNAELYVAAGGGMTATPPTARAQPVARVERVNANNGAVIVKVNGLSASDATANTLVRRDGIGGAQFVGLNTSTLDSSGITTTGQVEFNGTDAGDSLTFNMVNYSYGTGAASAHRIALGAGTTGDALFGAADAAAARTTLELGSLATINSPLPVANGGTGTTNGTAALNINGTVGATTPTTGAFTAITGSSLTSASTLVLGSTGANPINLIPGGTDQNGVRITGGTTGNSIGFYIANQTAASARWNIISFKNATLNLFSIDEWSNANAFVASRLTIAAGGATTINGSLSLLATTASTSTTTGALVVSGGVGIAGNINAGGSIAVTGTVRTGGYTFATLPTPTQGMRTFITDGAALPIYMANAAGGGSTVTPVFYNGTNWINA